MSDTRVPYHDRFNAVLTFGLCCVIVISYLLQHFRIIHAKSSEGINPMVLFVGTTSATSAMFNMIILQAPIVRCCHVLSFGNCMEMSAGIVLLALQWISFSIFFILYMLYYPEHLKYVGATSEQNPLPPQGQLRKPIKSESWRFSIIFAWCTTAYFVFIALTTAYIIYTVPDSPTGIPPPVVAGWATSLGLIAVQTAALQHVVQLLLAYRTKLVGTINIPMLLVQTPVGLLMALSIALRPRTNWTSWIPFAVPGILQGCLLVMCIMWKVRQRILQIDDFGNPLITTSPPPSRSPAKVYDPRSFAREDALSVPGIVTTPSKDTIVMHVPLVNAQETASEGHIMSPAIRQSEEEELEIEEAAPLLGRRERLPPNQGQEQERGWSTWFGR